MKTLIIYYSRGGATARKAKILQSLIGGDLFEIKSEKNYGNYFQAIGIARKEFNEDELPGYTTDIDNIQDYDRILIGFPIWYSKTPQVVISFMKNHNFEGKDVYPFCTSGMSGIDGAMDKFKEACKGAHVHDGLRVNKVKEKADLKGWLS